jgi:hypothetical protein
MFQGSWQPGRTKPSKEEIRAFDDFKNRIEPKDTPNWFAKLLEKREDFTKKPLALNTSSDRFTDFKQTEETELMKAVTLCYYAEHELDRKGSAEIAAGYTLTLLSKTTMDYELHALFARFLLDSNNFANAWKEARVGLYLNPSPSRRDLDFVAFVGLIAAKSQWTEIQQMLREAASSSADADAVIQEWAAKYTCQTQTSIRPIS